MGAEVVALSALAGLGGAALSAVGSVQAGDAAKSAADYNANLDRSRAASERDDAAASASDFIRKGSGVLGSAVAAQGASGVTMAGSPLMVDSDTIRQVALGAARTLQGGQKRGTQYENAAELQRAKGVNDQEAGYLKAGTSLLSGVSSFGKAGGFSGFGGPSTKIAAGNPFNYTGSLY